MVKILCLIPARSGSKRIKNKNIISFKKTNLLNFVLKKVINCKRINEFVIASDNYKIFKKIKINNKKISYFKRSKKTSGDKASSESVILEYLQSKKKHPDIIILLQITNPFIKSQYLDEAIKILLSKKIDCLFSAVNVNCFMWKNKLNSISVNYNYKKRPISQKFTKFFIENGSFYIFYTKKFIKYKNRLHKKIAIYEMPKYSLHEIDDHQDLKIVKKLV